MLISWAAFAQGYQIITAVMLVFVRLVEPSVEQTTPRDTAAASMFKAACVRGEPICISSRCCCRPTIATGWSSLCVGLRRIVALGKVFEELLNVLTDLV